MFLTVQWLRLHASNTGAAGSIPGLGTKIPHAASVRESPADVGVGCGSPWGQGHSVVFYIYQKF